MPYDVQYTWYNSNVWLQIQKKTFHCVRIGVLHPWVSSSFLCSTWLKGSILHHPIGLTQLVEEFHLLIVRQEARLCWIDVLEDSRVRKAQSYLNSIQVIYERTLIYSTAQSIQTSQPGCGENGLKCIRSCNYEIWGLSARWRLFLALITNG